MSQAPDMSQLNVANMGINPLGNVGNLFEIHGADPAVPTADTLISLKLLSEADPAYKKMMKEELKFLTAARSLLRADTYLRIKMGGDNLSASMRLANVLKARSETKHLNERLDNVVGALNQHTFATSLHGLGPAPAAASGVLASQGGRVLTMDMMGSAGGRGRAIVVQHEVVGGANPVAATTLEEMRNRGMVQFGLRGGTEVQPTGDRQPLLE